MKNQEKSIRWTIARKMALLTILSTLLFAFFIRTTSPQGYSILLSGGALFMLTLPLFFHILVTKRIHILRTDLTGILVRNHGARIRPLGKDEIGELGASINRMLDHRDTVHAKLEQHRMLDSITGLPNRGQFLKILSYRLDSFSRGQSPPPAMAIVALERFQRINDSLGTIVGDQILSEVGIRLSKLGGIEQVCRVSTSEFAMLLQKSPDPAFLTRFSESTRAWLEAPIPLGSGEREVHLKIRIGVTSASDMQNLGAQEILRRSEAALHNSRSDNTRSLALFNEELDRRTREQIELEKDLRRAIQAKEFLVAFQPIQKMDTGQLAGFEALVRWKHPTKGMISPMAFIPLAEELGLIEELGEQVLRTACKQVMDWSLQIPELSDTFISVNLSPKQFYDPLLLSKVWHAVQSSGLPYSRLKLEITESSIMDNPEDCSRRLRALHDLGIHLSLDDFGTGYSSFIHLDRFPVSTLKLDKSFVDKLLVDPQSPIVKSVATVAKVMGYELIAEGVEDASQAQCLFELGCGYIQGYLYAKPMFPDDLLVWYAKLPRPAETPSLHPHASFAAG